MESSRCSPSLFKVRQGIKIDEEDGNSDGGCARN